MDGYLIFEGEFLLADSKESQEQRKEYEDESLLFFNDS